MYLRDEIMLENIWSELTYNQKKEIGKYKLSFITPYLLNQSLLKIAQKYKNLCVLLHTFIRFA